MSEHERTTGVVPAGEEVTTGYGSGKLLVAGEYAVTRGARAALVWAVDRGATAELRTTTAAGGLRVTTQSWTDDFALEDLIADERIAGTIAGRNAYVLRIVQKCLQLARCRGRALPRDSGWEIDIATDLGDSVSGRKYGLGGSAAVTVAVGEAVCRKLGLSLSATELWKLCYLATIEVNPTASGADLAASVFGGWTLYRSPERERLARPRDGRNVDAALTARWEGLSLGRISPRCGDPVVGWSGEPASTPDLVQRVSPRLTESFLEASDAVVEGLARALDSGDHGAAARGVAGADELLRRLDGTPPAGIMTAELDELISLAADLGIPAKLSGAGGGDCCIAFPADDAARAGVVQAWSGRGYPVLPLGSAPTREVTADAIA